MAIRQFRCCHGNLMDPARRRMDHVRMPWRTRNAVSVMGYRVNAGIPRETTFDKDLQRPLGACSDRVTGSTVQPRGRLTGVFGSRYRFLGVLPEVRPSQFINQPMGVAVAPDFMSRLVNLPDYLWMTLRNPAQNKKSG